MAKRSEADSEDRPFSTPSYERCDQEQSPSGATRLQREIKSRSCLPGNRIILLTFCLQFLNYFAKHMTEVPVIKLIEQAVCNHHYLNHDHLPSGSDVEEQLCKIAPVQNRLTAITALKFTFDALPGLVTALYYGAIADRFGRRLVLGLCCIGNVLALIWMLFVCYSGLDLPAELIWASAIFLCIGGSQRVAKSMNFTVIADSTDLIHRTRYMFILAGIPHITTLMAPPLSGVLMRVAPWVPFIVAIAAYILGMLVLAIMPESLHHDAISKSPLLGPADTIDREDDEETLTSSTDQLLEHSTGSRVERPVFEQATWWRDLMTLFRLPGLPFCYFLYFMKPLAMISKAFVYQYASYNFHWPLSTTTWLRFSQAGGSTIATVIVLPLLHSILDRRGPKAQVLDMHIIRISLLVAVAGFITLQFSFRGWMMLLALFICGLSEGEEPALQSLTTSLIDRIHHARLFTSLAVVEISAKLIGGPIMGILFSIDKTSGIGSRGLCFSVSAGVLGLLFISTLFQRLAS